MGHRAPLLKNADGSAHEGKPSAEQAAESLAGMLHLVHPVSACREAMKSASSLNDKAAASWSCLDLSAANFTGALTSDSQDTFESAAVSAEPSFTDQLGACAGTQWHRACSFWVSMHAMAVRAEMHGQGIAFFEAVTRIIAGGALYCAGCTMHFVELNKHFLPTELADSSALYLF